MWHRTALLKSETYWRLRQKVCRFIIFIFRWLNSNGRKRERIKKKKCTSTFNLLTTSCVNYISLHHVEIIFFSWDNVSRHVAKLTGGIRLVSLSSVKTSHSGEINEFVCHDTSIFESLPRKMFFSKYFYIAFLEIDMSSLNQSTQICRNVSLIEIPAGDIFNEVLAWRNCLVR